MKILRNIELGDLNLFELLLRNTFIKRTDHLIDALEAVQDRFYKFSDRYFENSLKGFFKSCIRDWLA